MPPYGRGGAGNINAVEQAKAKIAADLEANGQSALTADSFDRQGEGLVRSEREEEEPVYKHSGRGGAGNYYSPTEFGGEGAVASKSSAQGTSSAAPVSNTRTPGRGGAGNYAFGVSEDESDARKRMEEKRKGEKLREDVERGVNERLALPRKARVSGGEA